MTREERVKKLRCLITCMKCEASGKRCDINCSIQYDAGNMGEIIENLEAISKALEQEPCDCISRAEAIKALDYELSIEADGGLDKYRTVINALLNAIYNTQKKAIEDLPSVQPIAKNDLSSELDKNSKKLEKDFGELDCISRADAIRVASGYCHPSNVAKEIAKLPSVTPQEPKTGHWEYGYAFPDGNYCKCSECKEIIKCIYPMHYCPNCGAKMVEPQESEET